MQTSYRSSLWFKLVGAFAVVTLLTLALSLAIFYVLSQEELARFLEQNSSSIQEMVRQSQLASQLQAEALSTGSGSEAVIEITVPLESAIQESTASRSTQFLGNLRRAAIVVVGFAAALAMIAGTFLFRQMTRPLSNLKNAALSLGEGELDVRVPVTTQDEVGQVSVSFNQMAEKLEEQDNLRRQMIADIAHELRTPLSVIQSNLEAMIDSLILPDAQELGQVHGEVMRLIRLTEDLRLLSLADAGQLQLAVSQVDVGDLIESTLHQMTPAAQSKEISLTGDIEGISTSVSGDADKLKQALMNLIANSLAYTPPGGTVIVQADQTQDKLDITVADDGPGIPKQYQPLIFERFWRGDRSRSRAGGGSGLGLAISQEIIHLHGGTITVDSPPTGGCSFTICLPLSQ